MADGTVLWTVEVPDGYRLDGQESDVQPTHPAGQSLRRAAAQLYFSAVLAEQVSEMTDGRAADQLLAAQERFYRYCSQAEYQLSRMGVANSDTGPEGPLFEGVLQF